MEPVAFRVSEFCQIYAISRASFYREIQANRLRIIKRGKSTLVARAEAERWFNSLPKNQPRESVPQIPYILGAPSRKPRPDIVI